MYLCYVFVLVNKKLFTHNFMVVEPFQIVGIDRKNGYRIMSFQELSSRGRGGKDTLVTSESIKVGHLRA